jgi:UDP-glucose 4-epimerase
MSNKIYVFGGAGFLGKAFCRACPDAVPCDSMQRLARAGLSGVEFDFGFDSPTSLPCGKGDSAVIFSWRGYPAAHDADPVVKLSMNLRRTLELVSWLAKRGVGGIFYASTGGAVYGNAGVAPISEAMALNPVGFYGIGKATAEMYVRKVCRESNIRHMVFRIGNAYGIDQIRDNLSVGFVAKAVQCAASGQPLEIWGAGETRRDYIHAEDVAGGFLKAIENGRIPSGVYNLGSGKSLSNLEVVGLVERVVGKKVEVVFKDVRAFDVAGICLDCSKIQEASGWEPRLSLEHGIREMAEILNHTLAAGRPLGRVPQGSP